MTFNLSIVANVAAHIPVTCMLRVTAEATNGFVAAAQLSRDQRNHDSRALTSPTNLAANAHSG